MEIRVRLGNLRARQVFAEWIKSTLDALVGMSMTQIKELNLAPLYDRGVYVHEVSEETFVDAETLASRNYQGDCAHLSVYRCAELRLAGEFATCRISCKRSKRRRNRWLFHVTVRRADGTIEDPSRILGM